MLTKEIEDIDIFIKKLLEDPDLKINIEAATKLGFSSDDRERTVDALTETRLSSAVNLDRSSSSAYL